MGSSNRGPNGIQGIRADILGLTYETPELIISSGFWRHPKPGLLLKIKVWVVGGGGGGSGRNTTLVNGGCGGGSGYVTEVDIDVTSDIPVTIGAGGAGGSGDNNPGSTGGTTTFGTSTALGGAFATTSTGGAGQCGGGGSGTTTASQGKPGGDGVWIGGGGGMSPTVGGAPGQGGRQNGRAGTAIEPGWPNGGLATGAYSNGGRGGWPGLVKPFLLDYGRGGNGIDGPGAGQAGTQGCVAIFYKRINT